VTAPTPHCSDRAVQGLTTGKVQIIRADATYFSATVQGSAAEPYQVMYERGWRCTCPATRPCWHIAACRAVWSPLPPPADRAEQARRAEAAFVRIGAPTREDDEL
jgi:uncharacterized Zn finger protein